MSLIEGGLCLYVAVSVIPVTLFLIFRARTTRSQALRDRTGEEGGQPVPVEVLVPITGVVSYHEPALRSLLEQDYEQYGVVLIVESVDDPANRLVDRLCMEYKKARKVISGVSECCAQKNHNLVEGVKHLRPDTEIIVFCDSTNEADTHWLRDFTRPLRAGSAHAVTTFRAFDPQPETVAGMSQAVYAACIVVLNASRPTPWGGATAIRRQTFDMLHVSATWASTVVDDLVLGNILRKAGLGVHFDPGLLLRSPLHRHTFRGLLAYLDRQILFPKFTNPLLWSSALICSVNLTIGLVVSLAMAALFPLGSVNLAVGLVSSGALALSVLAGLSLKTLNPYPLSVFRWLFSIPPLLLVGSFVFVRSIFLRKIEWHGTRYYPGPSGVVLRVGRFHTPDRVCS